MADAILAQSGIYQIRNTANGKVYVGSAVNPRTRLNYHVSNLRRTKHANSKLQRAWHRYGEALFELSVIEQVPNARDLIAREQYWIDTLDAVDAGYNIRRIAQSNLGLRATDATKAKMSASNKGRKMSAEARAKISAANKGRSRFTLEQRAQMSIDRKGRAHTEEARVKIGVASTGRKQSSATIEKRNASMVIMRAERGPIIVSEQARARISAANKGKPGRGKKAVLLFGIEYDSITAASLAIGRNPQWVKLRMGTDSAPNGDMHARMPVSLETRQKKSASLKIALNKPGVQARRWATTRAKREAKPTIA